jgi:hypothetical protein
MNKSYLTLHFGLLMDLKTYFIGLQSAQRATEEREANISTTNAKLQRGALVCLLGQVRKICRNQEVISFL